MAVSSPATPRGLIDTGAVLTDLFHLLADDSRTVAAAWTFLRSGAVTVLGRGDGDLPELETLMKRYADRPMDFADATLIHLARRERLNAVFMIGHDDFETYRIDGRRRFRIVPARV